jgi:hypothetical protein
MAIAAKSPVRGYVVAANTLSGGRASAVNVSSLVVLNDAPPPFHPLEDLKEIWREWRDLRNELQKG